MKNEYPHSPRSTNLNTFSLDTSAILYAQLETLTWIFTALRYAHARHFCCRPESVRLTVTFVYCIQTADDIVKLHPLPVPITVVFLNPKVPKRRYPIPRGTPSAGGGRQIHQRWGKSASMDYNRRLSRKRCKIGPWLLRNVDGKSLVADRSVSFPMTLSDLERQEASNFSGGSL